MVISARRMVAALALIAAAGCAPQRQAAPATAPPPVSSTVTPQPPADPAAVMREWTAVAGDHFKQSARALQQVSEASDSGDQAAVQDGCRQLHDTNAIGLQLDLPTPDPELTAELQRMIDDMNTATHACLRFVLGRNPADAEVYQDYLANAVEHLQRAKVILDDDLRPR